MGEFFVAIIMGSESDFKVMSNTIDLLKEFGVKHEVRILSAHRTPDALEQYIADAHRRGVKVFIAAAGYAAHLAGAIAGQTACPVIGIPLEGSALNGFDSLLSTVQMPGGVPVATVTIGKAGAKNAAILAVQMLGISDENLNKKLKQYREKMAEKVIACNKNYE